MPSILNSVLLINPSRDHTRGLLSTLRTLKRDVTMNPPDNGCRGETDSFGYC